MGKSGDRNSRGSAAGVTRRVLVMMIAVLAAIPIALTAPLSAPDSANAAVASAFDPGYIITDGLFYDGSAMSASDVQAFLNAKVPTCDSGHGGGSYTCLKDYVTSFAARASNIGCAAIPAGSMTAAEIIATVGQACNISQEVILVLLQKEQSLVTSTWPSTRQYDYATGYGCPDSTGCSVKYYGFFNQVYDAAWQFQRYVNDPNLSDFRYHAGGTYNIPYSPNTGAPLFCTGADVYIQNSATAGLYNYTPYQPNPAALANLYGTGDGCSSYGNRNFWRLYSDWFGNPTGITPTGVTVTRIGGADRYQTSAAISAAYFSPDVPVVYVADGDNYADAISAAPAAAHGRGPVLLIGSTSIPAPIVTELTRLKPQKIVVVGGPAVISDQVMQQLGQYSSNVTRVFGQDRYATSRAVLLSAFGPSVPALYMSSGAGFADALSASSAAGSRGAPVLLVDGSQPTLDAATQALLQTEGTAKVYLTGGTAVVTPGFEQSITTLLGTGSVLRLSGANRYATSSAINRERFTTASTFYVASGEAFPDALGAASVAGMQSMPLYVAQQACMPTALIQHIIDAKATSVVIIGGTAAISEPAARFRNC